MWFALLGNSFGYAKLQTISRHGLVSFSNRQFVEQYQHAKAFPTCVCFQVGNLFSKTYVQSPAGLRNKKGVRVCCMAGTRKKHSSREEDGLEEDATAIQRSNILKLFVEEHAFCRFHGCFSKSKWAAGSTEMGHLHQSGTNVKALLRSPKPAGNAWIVDPQTFRRQVCWPCNTWSTWTIALRSIDSYGTFVDWPYGIRRGGHFWFCRRHLAAGWDLEWLCWQLTGTGTWSLWTIYTLYTPRFQVQSGRSMCGLNFFMIILIASMFV